MTNFHRKNKYLKIVYYVYPENARVIKIPITFVKALAYLGVIAVFFVILALFHNVSKYNSSPAKPLLTKSGAVKTVKRTNRMTPTSKEKTKEVAKFEYFQVSKIEIHNNQIIVKFAIPDLSLFQHNVKVIRGYIRRKAPKSDVSIFEVTPVELLRNALLNESPVSYYVSQKVSRSLIKSTSAFIINSESNDSSPFSLTFDIAKR